MQESLYQNTVAQQKQTNSSSLKQKIENRDYNIITQQKIGQYDSQPKFPKLGQMKDYPYPKNQINYEKNIDFPYKGDQNKMLRPASEEQIVKQRNLMNYTNLNFNHVTLNQPSELNQFKYPQIAEHKLAYKTPQIAKITDLNRLFAPNFNQQYQEQYKQNQQCFNRQKGMCAETFNRMVSYGPGNKPFRKFK